MHNLKAMYEKTLKVSRMVYEEDVNIDDNFFDYPRKPKMSDLEIISLAVCSESASIDSENLLFSKLKKDYINEFPNLIDRSRYNRRRRRMSSQIIELMKRVGMNLNDDNQINIVDSVPCPIVKNSREKQFRICKEDEQTAPRKGYSAVDKRYFIGYKLHLLTSENGIIQDMMITPANVHDIEFLKRIEPEEYCYNKTIIGDRGYISEPVQTSLFDNYQIKLEIPYRYNQHNWTKYPPVYKCKRRRIETQFSQLCDQFKLKWNYAKTFAGFLVRIQSKLAAISVLQFVNKLNNRPLNQIKHAWT